MPLAIPQPLRVSRIRTGSVGWNPPVAGGTVPRSITQVSSPKHGESRSMVGMLFASTSTSP
ncbi:MAG: hypothetical protein EB037_08265 [Actinobacteria bacterium]|nr:hypothetical protein [Actinomycetota bacterium]